MTLDLTASEFHDIDKARVWLENIVGGMGLLAPIAARRR
jgi:hypothetical protein